MKHNTSPFTTTAPSRHDSPTIALHWLTALLVVVQFLLGEFWGFFPRPTHNLMVTAHMSLGLIFAAVFALRLVWRLRPGHSHFDDASDLLNRIARLMHFLLYALVGAEIVLGFFTRWGGGKAISFFGLLIPSPIDGVSKATHHLIDKLHDVAAWAIIILAGAHAAAALFHHYFLKDGILRRMLPLRG
ncbi:MAG TPA: cytochrome b/b6 domain-containing protein [Acidocella sp.]|nr:cytochrome b/b6 domain-containing protein [Acidocella sp.]